MTDERYVLQQDIRDRKSMASGARGVKKGSRSKRCSLPSDNLSKAQLEKMNGPVEYAKLGVPMTYSELMQLSPSLRFLYLDHCVNHYHARQTDLIRMLGCAQSTFFHLQKSLPGKLVFKGRSKRVSPEWADFLGKERPSISASETVEKAPMPEPASVSQIMSGSFTLRGPLDDVMVILSRMLPDTSRHYTFTVSFSQE